MNINSIGPSKQIKLYSDSKVKITKGVNIEKTDSVQISKEGRNLSNTSIDKATKSSPQRIEEIKDQIAQGTYAPNATLIAKKMVDIIKGREA